MSEKTLNEVRDDYNRKPDFSKRISEEAIAEAALKFGLTTDEVMNMPHGKIPKDFYKAAADSIEKIFEREASRRDMAATEKDGYWKEWEK